LKMDGCNSKADPSRAIQVFDWNGGALIWMGPVIHMAAQPVVMEPRMAAKIFMPMYRTWSPASNLFDSFRWPEERVVW